jgi:hypothetical protein
MQWAPTSVSAVSYVDQKKIAFGSKFEARLYVC